MGKRYVIKAGRSFVSGPFRFGRGPKEWQYCPRSVATRYSSRSKAEAQVKYIHRYGFAITAGSHKVVSA